MRVMLAAVAVVMIGACEPAPAMLGKVDLGKPMRALGTEPFWGVEIRPDEVVFTGVDRPEFRAPNPGAKIAGATAVIAATDAAGVTLSITLRPDECSDGMSDWVYPLKADVEFAGETLTGCADSQISLDERPRP